MPIRGYIGGRPLVLVACKLVTEIRASMMGGVTLGYDFVNAGFWKRMLTLIG